MIKLEIKITQKGDKIGIIYDYVPTDNQTEDEMILGLWFGVQIRNIIDDSVEDGHLMKDDDIELLRKVFKKYMNSET